MLPRLRILAVAVVVAHVGAVAAPPLVGSAEPAAPPSRAEHAHAGSDASAQPGAEHCAGHRAIPPVQASAPCPCGCDDGAPPGASQVRVGSALLVPEPPVDPVVAGPSLPATRAALPRAPVRTPDPIPI